MSTKALVMSQSTHSRGLVLVTSLGVMVFLAILGSSFLVRSLHENQTTDRSRSQSRALFLAEASVDTALNQLSGGNTGNVPTTTMSDGTYWAQVTLVAPFTYQVTGHGLHASQQRDIAVVTQQTPQSVFQYALFGSQRVNVSGQAITDSYDSSLGSYGVNPTGKQGNVGTNATTNDTDEGVDVGGTIAINGHIAVGAGVADPASVVEVSGSAIITETPPIVAQSANLLIPPDNPPLGLSCDTSLSINNNQVVTLPAGGGSACSTSTISTCCFKDVKVSGGTLNTNGPIAIYVKNQFDAKGEAVLGVPSDPSQLLVVLLTPPNQATIEGDFSGQAKFYGELYAPAGDIDIKGQAEIFGSIVAKIVNISGNAQVHYDEALAKDPGRPVGSYDVDVVEWQDLN